MVKRIGRLAKLICGGFIVISLVGLLGACGSAGEKVSHLASAPTTASPDVFTLPDYTGKTLDVAQADLKAHGIKLKSIDSVDGKIVLSSKNWVVENHLPGAGTVVKKGETVKFNVSKPGAADAKATKLAADAAATKAAAEQAATQAAADKTAGAASTNANTPVTDITVDELLDKLNSGRSGGLRTGDRFRLTGELFMSELWMTGATGEYSVLLKAQGGAQDLSVFVDKAAAARWRDGTKVQMVVEVGEATINGETTDGWLRVQSAKTIQ